MINIAKSRKLIGITFILILVVALLPTTIQAQLTCELPPPPLDDPGFVDSIAESFWNKTDFCQFKEGVIAEINSGGVQPDGIPPIDNPTFDSIAVASEWLQPQSPVIAVELNGESRAYPLAILTRHEIANDELGGVPVAVTFCPLCNSAIVYDRRVDGETYRFGVSGLLRNSDLIMWDNVTQTWWQQLTGEGIVGTHTGHLLDIVPSQLVGFSAFVEQYPEGTVLSNEGQRYGTNPYAGYDTSQGRPFLFLGQMDIRRAPVDRVLGADINGETIAFTFEALSEEIVVNYTIGGEDVVAFWQPGAVSALDQSVIDESRDVGMAGLFNRSLDGQMLTFSHQDGIIIDDQTGSTWNVFGTATSGDLTGSQLQQINAFPHFWFAWAAFHPDTEIYGEVKTLEAPNTRAELDPVLGNPDASVTIIEYGAYACPSCKAWHEAEIIEQILEEYPDQVKFIFRDFPVISPNYDRMAAELAQCVLDQSQDLFWAFHDALYTIARVGSSEADLIEIARMVGVDTDVLQSCADSDIHVATVEYDFQRGMQMGLPGTPSFIVNGQSIFNASPEMLRSIIEEELASSDS